MVIIKHNKEVVEFYSLTKFASIVKKHYNAVRVVFSENNDGMILYYINGECDSGFKTWTELAEDMEWFDEAEIVTDKNENEKVMTWLNVD